MKSSANSTFFRRIWTDRPTCDYLYACPLRQGLEGNYPSLRWAAVNRFYDVANPRVQSQQGPTRALFFLLASCSLWLIPLGTKALFAILLINPSVAVLDDQFVEPLAVDLNQSHYSSISVNILLLDIDIPSWNQAAGQFLRFLAKALIHFGSIDPVQPNPQLAALPLHIDCVAIGDRKHLGWPCETLRWGGDEKKKSEKTEVKCYWALHAISHWCGRWSGTSSIYCTMVNNSIPVNILTATDSAYNQRDKNEWHLKKHLFSISQNQWPRVLISHSNVVIMAPSFLANSLTSG